LPTLPGYRAVDRPGEFDCGLMDIFGWFPNSSLGTFASLPSRQKLELQTLGSQAELGNQPMYHTKPEMHYQIGFSRVFGYILGLTTIVVGVILLVFYFYKFPLHAK